MKHFQMFQRKWAVLARIERKYDRLGNICEEMRRHVKDSLRQRLYYRHWDEPGFARLNRVFRPRACRRGDSGSNRDFDVQRV
jgi:hypothetical protein